MDGYFIQLTNPITYPSVLYDDQILAWLDEHLLEEIPSLTHWQLCNFEFEFIDTGSEPHAIAWLGLVYFSNDVKYKPPVPGKVIELTGQELELFAISEIGDINCFLDIQKEMQEYLVDNGYLDGTVVLIQNYG